MYFSVIIPSCGRPESLKKCLHALSSENQSDYSDKYEIIISDDRYSKTLETEIRAIYPEVYYIPGPGLGPSANRNHASKIAKGKILIFIDDDCVPEKTLLKAYFDAVKQNIDTKVFEGRIFADRPQQSFDETSPLNETGGRLWSCNFAIYKDFFISIGGFNENFKYAAMEDVELQKRILNSSHKILFVSKAAVCHPWRKKRIADFKNHAASTLLYLKIHPDESNKINPSYYLYLVTYGLIKFVLPRIVKGHLKGLHIQMAEYYYYLRMSLKLALLRHSYKN